MTQPEKCSRSGSTGHETPVEDGHGGAHLEPTAVTQRDLERTGIAARSTIAGLLTGRSWIDMWIVARIVTLVGGELGVKGP